MRKENSINAQNESYLHDFCPAFKTLLLINGRWKLNIIFYLNDKKNPATYSDFKELLPSISDRMLAKQLNELIRDDIIIKNKKKNFSFYSLTKKGKRLEPILKELRQFDM
ncbi:MAG: helix-turn-helix transcriptional regulator [Neisseriaceae bacterium]|nr:transcriptional regulator [Neisseriaceae bacterium PsAf]MCV2503177.1 helix-turn-helix transcriptional regulator [Neisseriaceae bacterium]MCV2508976.1 helix-turn-helix transcriptional regulator [Neisseriaceae bacterium]